MHCGSKCKYSAKIILKKSGHGKCRGLRYAHWWGICINIFFAFRIDSEIDIFACTDSDIGTDIGIGIGK